MCDDASSAASADVGSPPSVEPPFRDPPPSRSLCCFVFSPLGPGESIAATSSPEQRTMMAYVERGLSPVGQRMIDSRTGGPGTGGCEGPSGCVRWPMTLSRPRHSDTRKTGRDQLRCHRGTCLPQSRGVYIFVAISIPGNAAAWLRVSPATTVVQEEKQREQFPRCALCSIAAASLVASGLLGNRFRSTQGWLQSGPKLHRPPLPPGRLFVADEWAHSSAQLDAAWPGHAQLLLPPLRGIFLFILASFARPRFHAKRAR